MENSPAAQKLFDLIPTSDLAPKEFNAARSLIRQKIKDWDQFGTIRLGTFDDSLELELKTETSRRAYMKAILAALGEDSPKKKAKQIKSDSPDKFCVTAASGDCISSDSRCIHNLPEPVVFAELPGA